MHGKNPIRPPESGDGGLLQVQEIFPTLQGEGPRAGEPAVFVRLGGCNLACDFCDTEFERFAPMPLAEIVARVRALSLNGEGARARHLAVITGGEPLRQNIAPLSEALIAEDFTVQIETNGTLFRPLPEAVEIVCSPKNAGRGYAPLRPDLLSRARALKFIVSATHPLYRKVAELGQGAHGTPVFVQPMDEGDAARNLANRAHAAELCARHGYRLSLQLHKIMGIP